MDPRDPSLPPRFRSSAFRRYESVLEQAVNASPNEVIADPKHWGLSLTTVEQRLRDARRSYYDYKWLSTIPHEKFVRLVDEGFLEVRACADGKIHIGHATDTEKRITAIVGSIVTSVPKSKPPPLKLNGWDAIQAKELLAYLAQERALARPLHLDLSDAAADELYASFDVLLEKQSDGSYILT